MSGVAVIYHTFDEPVVETHKLTAAPKLDYLKGAVGGWIESVPGLNTIEHDGALRECVAFCNEEGKLHGLPFNEAATRLWDAALRRLPAVYPTGLVNRDGSYMDVLCGSIIVLYGDADFMAEL